MKQAIADPDSGPNLVEGDTQRRLISKNCTHRVGWAPAPGFGDPLKLLKSFGAQPRRRVSRIRPNAPDARRPLPGDTMRLMAQDPAVPQLGKSTPMIRKLKSGGYRLYSRKIDPKTGRRRNLGTFKTRAAAEKHERAVQFFKRH
jgi:hypothetical protein